MWAKIGRIACGCRNNKNDEQNEAAWAVLDRENTEANGEIVVAFFVWFFSLPFCRLVVIALPKHKDHEKTLIAMICSLCLELSRGSKNIKNAYG